MEVMEGIVLEAPPVDVYPAMVGLPGRTATVVVSAQERMQSSTEGLMEEVTTEEDVGHGVLVVVVGQATRLAPSAVTCEARTEATAT